MARRTMELLILRHGKSSWSDPSLDDYDRPLKKRGKDNARSMGQYIKTMDLVPELIISSTARRAAATAKRAARNCGYEEAAIIWERKLYHAGVETWLRHLSKVPNQINRVMIVGHNPGLEDLTHHLCGGKVPHPSDGKLIPTATLAVLDIEEPWLGIGQDRATLRFITRPRQLTNTYRPPSPD